MRFSNAFIIGLSVLAFTFCKKRDELTPKSQTPTEEGIGISAVTQFDYVIKADQQVVDASTLNLPEGAVVGIEAGTRGTLLLKNFTGTSSKPITIVNKGGKVIITGASSNSYALKAWQCKYIRISGTGDGINNYGIELKGTHQGLMLDYLTTNAEVDHVEVHDIGFAGIMAKTDPSCDPATWRENLTITDISLHDNYVHNTVGEGFYVGNSFWSSGMNLSCGTKYPSAIEGVRIYNNKVRHTGCEGIQVGSAAKDCEVFNNDVQYFGESPFANSQNNGIQIGEGTGGKLYNNIIKNGPGVGIILLGIGDNVVSNNIIVDAGAQGIFVDERYTPGNGFTLVNNTIINSGSDGIRLYSEKVPMNTVINNIIVNPKSGKYINTASGVKLTAKNNYTTMNIADVKFASASNGDYSLLSGSPAIDQGVSTASFGVTSDYLGSMRPAGASFDIGAFEYGSSGGTTTPPDDGGTTTTPPDDGETSTTPPDDGNGDGGTTTPPNQSAPKITSFTLVDAETNRDLATIANGYEINLATIGTQSFNIRANTSVGVSSVLFQYNGSNRTENSSPYALFGDSRGNYTKKSLETGSYTLSGTPYTAAHASGTKGTTETIRFTVINKAETPKNVAPVITPVPALSMTAEDTKAINIATTDADGDAVVITSPGLPAFASLQLGSNNSATIHFKPGTSNVGQYNITIVANDQKGGVSSSSFKLIVEKKPDSSPGDGDSSTPPDQTAPKVTSFTLIDAETNRDLLTITNGAAINLSKLGTRSFNIRANTSDAVSSVLFQYDRIRRTESSKPYALFGDANGNYTKASLKRGSHSLSGIPYTGKHNSGKRGEATTVHFTIIDR